MLTRISIQLNLLRVWLSAVSIDKTKVTSNVNFRILTPSGMVDKVAGLHAVAMIWLGYLVMSWARDWPMPEEQPVTRLGVRSCMMPF